MDGDIPESYYKQVEIEEEPETKAKGKILIKFVKETCNIMVIVQHPGEDPYLEASHAVHGRLTLTDTPLVQNVDTAETLVEGIVEDVTDSDFEGDGQKQPQNKKQENECEAPCDFNSAMVTCQLGNRTRLPVHEIPGTQP